MPGPASHLTIVELEAQRAAAMGGPVSRIAAALNGEPTAAGVGSIGPDMLFWADWGSYTPFVNVIFDVYEKYDEIVDTINSIWGPIQRAIDKVENSLTGGLAGEIQQTVGLAKSLIQSCLIKLITEWVDYPGLFLKPKLQDNSPNSPETEWNWLDFTHHRGTGRMSKALIRLATERGSVLGSAYAFGWLSHVTADVIGHSYVNMAVGGPFRAHWQRHFIQEKFMDTWVWGFYHTPGITMPPAPTMGIPFPYASFTNVNTANLHKLIDVGSDLPGPLSQLIADALSEAYEAGPHPSVGGTVPFLRSGEVNRAYKMLKRGLEIMTGKDRHVDRPTPPSVFGDDEPPTFPLPGGGSGGGGGGGGGSGGWSFDLDDLLKAILDYILDIFEYLGDLGLWLVSKVTHPLTYPVRLALYYVKLGLYNALRATRWALAVTGYMFPEPDELFHPYGQQFINPPGSVSAMPHQEDPPERDKCTRFPLSAGEPRQAPAGPWLRSPLNFPFWFIEGEPSDPNVEQALVAAATPEETIRITTSLTRASLGENYRGSLGNAVDFFLRRAREINASPDGVSKLVLPAWNLDADRGYGFKCWRANSKLRPPPSSGVSVSYL
ncbi:MAG: zinc dependent phospholipase C family protein [Phycisphaerales bacterium]